MRTTFLLYLLSLSFIYLSCSNTASKKALPKIGQIEITENGDTLYHTIPSFDFTNQLGTPVNNKSLENHVYVTDFFFTSCPSICPKVMKNMLTIYDKFESNEQVKLVSFTIDPKRDTEEHLKRYADNLGVNHDNWWFLTGDKDELLDLADEYFIVALEDENAPGGFDHSGKIILVDKEGHVRAFCEGTDSEEVANFLPKIDQLLSEYQN